MPDDPFMTIYDCKTELSRTTSDSLSLNRSIQIDCEAPNTDTGTGLIASTAELLTEARLPGATHDAQPPDQQPAPKPSLKITAKPKVRARPVAEP
eukprot:7728959-Lingulodinium_polyedra.AAC.1